MWGHNRHSKSVLRNAPRKNASRRNTFMTVSVRQRRIINCLFIGAMLIGQVAAFLALPRPAKAALSADPNGEIVYIDDNGVIRVLDTQGSPLVQWFSPDGGWDQIVLLDVNNDGD